MVPKVLVSIPVLLFRNKIHDMHLHENTCGKHCMMMQELLHFALKHLYRMQDHQIIMKYEYWVTQTFKWASKT